MRTITLTGSILLGISGLQAAVINLNTGQTSPGGTVQTFSDPIWSINSAPVGTGINQSGAAFIEVNSYPRGDGINKLWQTASLPASTVANYISAGDCGRYGYTAACGAGTYSLSTNFVVNSLASLSLTYQIAGDNAVALYLNGALLTSQGDSTGLLSTGWATLSPSATATTGFHVGVNTLELRVINADLYTGGLVAGQVSGDVSATPEPAAYMLTAAALIGLGLIKRGRRQVK